MIETSIGSEPTHGESSSQRWPLIARWLIAAAAALHFSIDYLTLTAPMIPFGPYLQGQIPGPFRYRILVAWIYRGFAVAIGQHRLPTLNPPFDSQQGWFLALLSTASLLLAVFATERSICKVAVKPAYRWLSLLVIEMAYFNYILPPHRGLFYPYDLPAVAFFAVLTWLALEARYVAFALVFPLAELNRETVIYALVLFLLLHAGHQPWKRLVPYVLSLGVVFVAIKYALYLRLQGDCKGCATLSQNMLSYNFRQLANPIFWIAASSVFSYGWIALIPLWKDIQPRLRLSFLLLAALWVTPMCIVGVLRELRVFAELSPLLIVLLANGLAQRSKSLQRRS